jgi:hypothetical protein
MRCGCKGTRFCESPFGLPNIRVSWHFLSSCSAKSRVIYTPTSGDGVHLLVPDTSTTHFRRDRLSDIQDMDDDPKSLEAWFAAHPIRCSQSNFLYPSASSFQSLGIEQSVARRAGKREREPANEARTSFGGAHEERASASGHQWIVQQAACRSLKGDRLREIHEYRDEPPSRSHGLKRRFTAPQSPKSPKTTTNLTSTGLPGGSGTAERTTHGPQLSGRHTFPILAREQTSSQGLASGAWLAKRPAVSKHPCSRFGERVVLHFSENNEDSGANGYNISTTYAHNEDSVFFRQLKDKPPAIRLSRRAMGNYQRSIWRLV